MTTCGMSEPELAASRAEYAGPKCNDEIGFDEFISNVNMGFCMGLLYLVIFAVVAIPVGVMLGWAWRAFKWSGGM